MQKIVDYLTWGFIMLFAAPTVLIMASWNSLPGTPMFAVKRASEQVLLFAVRPSYDAQTSLNAQYTKRRMDEAKVLLAKNQSSEGLSYLSAQITASRIQIQNAPTQEKKREAAKKYITTLKGVSNDLKTQQSASRRLASAKPKTGGNSQQQLQAQLQQQIRQVQELQSELQAQIQQPQTQQLLSQLQQQAQKLQQLQQQVQQSDQQALPPAALVQQIEVQAQQVDTIQDQVAEVVPSSNNEVDTIQEQIDDTIQ